MLAGRHLLRSPGRARRPRRATAIVAGLLMLGACAPADDGSNARDTVADSVADASQDTLPSPGWRQVTDTDAANPFGASPEVVSRYLDESLRYRPVATYWVQIPGPQPDSAQVRFEAVIGSDRISEDAFAEDGHVVARYVLESRDRGVPGLGLSPNDTLGYAYVFPGRAAPGAGARFRARFVTRTPNGGWRPAGAALTVIPGASVPPGVPEGAWLVWGEHADSASRESRDSLSRELLQRPYTLTALDWCFACGGEWCFVTEGQD